MIQYSLAFVPFPFIPVEKHVGASASLLTEPVEPILPVRKTPGSVGVDVATPYDFSISAGKTAVVETGLVWVPDPSWMEAFCLLILSRSGLAAKGVCVANAPGLIDLDYTGPNDTLKIILHNFSDSVHHFKRGDRIAQIVLAPFEPVRDCLFASPARITDTSRGGLGSTGT